MADIMGQPRGSERAARSVVRGGLARRTLVLVVASIPVRDAAERNQASATLSVLLSGLGRGDYVTIVRNWRI